MRSMATRINNDSVNFALRSVSERRHVMYPGCDDVTDQVVV